MSNEVINLTRDVSASKTELRLHAQEKTKEILLKTTKLCVYKYKALSYFEHRFSFFSCLQLTSKNTIIAKEKKN